MIIIKNPQEIQAICSTKNDIGFVPTMGALHQGHISLIKKSICENKITIVSIFVNPTQFGENEDFDNYPKQIKTDIKICEKENIDILFLPTKDNMYFSDESQIKANPISSYKLEGIKRAGHFDGVLMVVLKLLNIVQADKAYFGKKDAQQVLLIEKMARTLFLKTKIVKCETIREQNGIAMSSRNIYLNEKDTKKLQLVSKSLFNAQDMVLKGETKSNALIQYIEKELNNININYIYIIDKELNKCSYVIISHNIILLSVSLNNISYIDNIWL